MTQDELATASGLRQPDVSKIERGTIQQTTAISRLATALNVTAMWLELGEGDAPPWLSAAPEVQETPRTYMVKTLTGGQPPGLHVVPVSSSIFTMHEALSATLSGTLPAVFTLALEDEAVGITGIAVVWAKGNTARPGQWVLARDRHGRLHAREYRQGKAPASWIAHATNAAYASFDSTEDGLEIVAARIGAFDEPFDVVKQLLTTGYRP